MTECCYCLCRQNRGTKDFHGSSCAAVATIQLRVLTSLVWYRQ